jgi:O-antigen ligase
VPLCAGVAVLLALERPPFGRGTGWLDWSLLACLAVVGVQLFPLSPSTRDRLSPHAAQIDRALRLDGAPDGAAMQALSIDAESTAWAFALGAAYVGLFLGARSIFSRGGVRTVSRGITWLGLGLTVLVAAQRATSPSMLYWYFRPLDAGASPYGPFVSRNALATWLAMAAPIAVGYLIARDRSDRRPHSSLAAKLEAMDSTQLWLAVAACLMTGAVFASMSRAGILGMAAGVLAFIAASRTRIRRGRAAVWTVAGLGTLALIGLMFANFGALAMRLQETTESGVWGRRAIWRDTWRMAQDFWITGVGAGAFEQGMLLYQQGSRVFFFNHAHDEYLQIFVEGGILLAVPAAIAVTAGAMVIASRMRSDRTPIFWIRAGAVAGIVAVAVQSIWDTGLRTPANGALFAIIAAIATHQPRASVGRRE